MRNVAVVILNFNDYHTTETLVKSIKDYQNIEHIVVVDNCSTDNSYERLALLRNNKIDVIKSKKNGGYGYGNNYGIKYALSSYKPDYYMICNPDVEFKESLIDKLIAALISDSCYVCCSAIPHKPDGSVQMGYAWDVPKASNAVLATGKILQKFFSFGFVPHETCKNNEITEVGCVPGSLIMLKGEYVEKHDLYDENMFLYYEETVLGYKIQSEGYKTIIVNDGYVHHHSVTINKTISSTVKQRKIMYKSLLYYLEYYLKLPKWKLIVCRGYLAVIVNENYLDGVISSIKRFIRFIKE